MVMGRSDDGSRSARTYAAEGNSMRRRSGSDEAPVPATRRRLGGGASADPAVISKALFVGADVFVDKTIDPVVFLQSLRRAADREMVLATPAGTAVGDIVEGIERRRDADVRLTEREREVLKVA